MLQFSFRAECRTAGRLDETNSSLSRSFCVDLIIVNEGGTERFFDYLEVTLADSSMTDLP